MPALSKYHLLLILLSPVCLGLMAVSIAAGVRARSVAAGLRTAVLVLAWLVVIAVLLLVLPARLLEVLLIACALAAWISRLPYFVRAARIGRLLATVPDRLGPQFTLTAGALMVAAGLLLMSGKGAGLAASVRPYIGISIILLGITLGLNFLFPTRIGSAGILDSYGGLSTWDNIESYAWSDDGAVLELRLRRSLAFRHRFLPIPAAYRSDIAAYLSHRLWGAEEPPLGAPRSSEG